MVNDKRTPLHPVRSDWATYRRLLRYAMQYRVRLGLGILFGMLFGGSTFGLLVSFQGGMSRVFGGSDIALVGAIESWASSLLDEAQTNLVVTLVILSFLPLFALLRGTGNFFSKYMVEWVGHRVVMDLRNELFSHIQDLPLLVLGRNRTGELMSRTTNDTQQVERGVSTVIGDLLREPFVLTAAIIMLVHIDARLALISMLVFPVCIVPVAVFGRKVRRSSREGQAKLGHLSAVQQETLVGCRIVKAFGTEQEEKGRFEKISRAVFRDRLRVTQARAMLAPVIELMAVCIGCVLLLYARWTQLSWDQLLMFLGTLVVVYDPVKKLSKLHLGIQQASASADRIFEILDESISVRDSKGAIPFNEVVEHIKYDHVHFAYGDLPVIYDIQLNVKAGECIALVGSTGSGKTTLVSLLPRFYDVSSGAILINDQDVRGFSLSSLRKHIGIVTQETILFDRTVADNIAYGSPEATLDQIEDAARRAHAHEFIMQIDGGFGYQSLIGERGSHLSGGQRQRLAIARALLRNPPILILDEATSALDSESERHIQAALDELMVGRTVFAIAHRLSTIQHADRIVVLKNGRICEEGTHLQLLARGGAYKHFHDLQFMEK